MKMPDSVFSRMLLAWLPFMAYAGSGVSAWRLAAAVAGLYWLSLLFFWPLRRFFPEAGARQVFPFWLALWGQLLWGAAGLAPFWVLSVYLLFPPGALNARKTTAIPKKQPGYFFGQLIAGAGFFVFAGALSSACALDPARGFVVTPAWIFLMMFVAVYLWNRPSVRSPRKDFGAAKKEASS